MGFFGFGFDLGFVLIIISSSSESESESLLKESSSGSDITPGSMLASLKGMFSSGDAAPDAAAPMPSVIPQ